MLLSHVLMRLGYRPRLAVLCKGIVDVELEAHVTAFQQPVRRQCVAYRTNGPGQAQLQSFFRHSFTKACMVARAEASM